VIVSLALNVAISLAAFRLLTPGGVSTRALLPGAILLGAAWSVLQLVGGYLVSHKLQQTSEIYGLFAIVLGLMFWLYLAAQISLYAAELNVVLARRLYPRSITQPPLTDSDRRALRYLAQQEERRPEQRVRVVFLDEPAADRTDATDGGTPPSSTATAEPRHEPTRSNRPRARSTRTPAGTDVRR
jgi:Virulence factor BrkB